MQVSIIVSATMKSQRFYETAILQFFIVICTDQVLITLLREQHLTIWEISMQQL